MNKPIYIIMQARVGSTRLPGKILKTVLGKTILEYDIERCLMCGKADGVIIATTHEPDADQIIDVCRKFPGDRVKTFRGSLDDVLARYYLAAKEYGAEWIVRITSDCPLLDPDLVDEIIVRFGELRSEDPGIHLLTNNMPPTYPHGLDVEIFTFESLERAFNEAKKPYDREHVTPYIRTNRDLFTISSVFQDEDQSFHRWTLDYPEDFELIKAVLEGIYPENPKFTRHDVIKFLDDHPEIFSVNQHLRR